MMHIKKPTLIVDHFKAAQNIKRMLDKAAASQVVFRPHFKTHQSAQIGALFRKNGVQKITVSSVSMAQYFASHGWKDITIAFPVNLLEIDDINRLAGNIKLQVLVESVYSAQKLAAHIQHKLGIFIKIDTGYHRSGLNSDDVAIGQIIEVVSQSHQLAFMGFLTHAGHTYQARGQTEILAIMEEARLQLTKLKNKFVDQFPDLILSYGDTPSCSIAENFRGFDEIRPGNFVFYDVMQYHIGSCKMEEIAVAVACPVVAIHPERKELVIYGGGVHLSKESIDADQHFKLYGYIVTFNKETWGDPIPGAYVSSLSQEHGIVKMPEACLSKIKPGDVIGIIPIHSCLTANLLRI